MTDRLRIFDTTLRDGEQSPGATMTVDEKLEVAVWLPARSVLVLGPIRSVGQVILEGDETAARTGSHFDVLRSEGREDPG